jgi:thymidine kinase
MVEHAAHRTGWIEVVCGSMFSGKTEELLRRLKRVRLARQPYMLFKPRVDNRYDAVKVVSHEGLAADALPVADADELLSLVQPGTAVVGIDETQFFDGAIVTAAEALASRGLRVIAAGLDQDWQGAPFGPIPSLMAVAEYVTKLHAVCARCGAAATRSQRLAAVEEQLFVGGASAYEARCRACFVPRAVRG